MESLNLIQVVLELGATKLQGTILKLSTLGIMVELDTIAFPVGAFLQANFVLDDQTVLSEKVRSIKHYDNFYRNMPNKKLSSGEIPAVPKKLCEFHFQLLTESGRVAITRYLLAMQKQHPKNK